MTRVYFVRHGTHDLVNKALAGRMPGVHLAEQGRAQARALAAYFADRDVIDIVSSPLDRCRETAEPIADRLAVPVTFDQDLIEWDCGAWTGQSFEALRDDPQWHRWNTERAVATVPQGEPMAAVQARVMRVLERLGSADREPAILVSHSDVIKAALLALLDAPLDRHDRLEIEPASVTTLDLWPQGGKIVRCNETVAS